MVYNSRVNGIKYINSFSIFYKFINLDFSFGCFVCLLRLWVWQVYQVAVKIITIVQNIVKETEHELEKQAPNLDIPLLKSFY